MFFKCPVCELALIKAGKSLYCNNNHTFDLSKHGYVNLLLNNQMNSKNPGDSKEMLISRHNFLNSGYYDQLLFEIAEIIGNFIGRKTLTQLNLLDLGCGEGYYICLLKKRFDNLKSINNCYGVDISKYAIALAAKRQSGVNFIVGNSFMLPFFSESFDIIFSIFSQFNEVETSRVLKPKSLFIIIGPGKNHLSDFIKMIYDKPLEHQRRINPIDSNMFELIQTKELNYVLNLHNKVDINNLFIMTPYYWQANLEKQKKILELSDLDLEIHFNIEVYMKI